ncbi:MAG: RICIN domain-containing protein [Coriobacteriia bacterium]|nr:RICIN domain-containing protein [Coriobacteriia bacterium]
MNTSRDRFPGVYSVLKPAIIVLITLILALGMMPLGTLTAYAAELGPEIQDMPNDYPADQPADQSGQVITDPSDPPSEVDPQAIDPADSTTEAIEPLAVYVPDLCYITSVVNKSKAIDIPGASKNDGARIQLWDSNTTVAQRFQVIANSDGTYTFVNVNSGKALDVQGGNAFKGAVVWQHTRNGTNAQKWYITDEGNGYKISSKIDPYFVLDVPGAQAVNGNQLQLHDNNNTPAQRFWLNPITRSLADGAYIINSASGTNMVLDIAGASSQEGTIAQFHTSNQTLAQRFLLAYDSSTGYYTITNTQSNRVIDIAGGSTANGAKVQIWHANGTPAQKWAIQQTSFGTYTITSGHSGKVLGAPPGGANNTTPVQTFPWSVALEQQWRFTSSQAANNGTFVFRAGVGTVLDARGNGTGNGTEVWAFQANNTIAQKFYLQYVSDGYFRIECLNSQKLVTAQGTNIVLYENQNLNSQLWRLEPWGEGRFFLINKESGRALDVIGGSTASGAGLQVHTPNQTPAQQWRFEPTVPVANGIYVVKSTAYPSLALDIRGNSSANGTRLQIHTANNTIAQVFRFYNTSAFNYRITCLNSNKSLDLDRGILSPKGIIHLWATVEDSPNNNQVWRVEYYGGGNYRIFSQCGNGSYCMTIEGGIGTDITATAYDSNSNNQRFTLNGLGDAYYAPMNMTVSQMVNWQRSNPYINNITDQQLADVIDPNRAINNYTFPGHSEYTNGLYQFADLRSYTGLNAGQIDAIINSYTSSSSALRGMGYAFERAARTYNINEVYLLAHCALESGWGTSDLARGYDYNGTTLVDGRTWPAARYHNFFGIGAVDSGPLSGGRAYAIMNGWDSIEKAIIGGCKWIVENYIYRDVYNLPYAQPTLYAMKWDYNRSYSISDYGWHQYATDHLWARKISKMMGDFYNQVGAKPNLTYIIPQYRN